MAVAIVGDEIQRLGGIERIRTGFSHYDSMETSVVPANGGGLLQPNDEM
jgi:hypothetical protein